MMCSYYIVSLQKSHTPITSLICPDINTSDFNSRWQSATRNYATMRTQQPGSLPEYEVDPYQLLEDDLKDVYSYIKQVNHSCL